MTTSDQGPTEDEEGRKRGTLVILLLAFLLAAGTIFGIVGALDSSSPDRVAPSSTAPVYGAP